MNKTKAIRAFCLDCTQGSTKDIAFCTASAQRDAPPCSLWEYRLGFPLNSTRGIRTMADNIKKYPKDFEELKSYGCDQSLYLPAKTSPRPVESKKNPRSSSQFRSKTSPAPR